jgi:hypothetical protein
MNQNATPTPVTITMPPTGQTPATCQACPPQGDPICPMTGTTTCIGPEGHPDCEGC